MFSFLRFVVGRLLWPFFNRPPRDSVVYFLPPIYIGGYDRFSLREIFKLYRFRLHSGCNRKSVVTATNEHNLLPAPPGLVILPAFVGGKVGLKAVG